MKILHIIDNLNIGGAEKVCLNLITLLLDAGHQTDCMVISEKGQLYNKIDKRSKAIFLDRGGKYNIFAMCRCASATSGYDIVHVHMRHTWAYVKLACLIFKPNIRLIFHDHYGDIGINKNPTFRLKGPLKPRYYLGVTGTLTDWAVDNLGISKHSVFLLENTIVLQNDYSNKYNGDWVMVSNLRQTKNIIFAINLAERMKRKLVIFGNHDGSLYADEVLRYAEKSDFVTIKQGEIEIQQYLNNFHIGLHTAVSETGPLVLLEFLSHGLPFVTFDTGEVANQIRDELSGFIASTFNEEEWVRKIVLLENDKSEALKAKLKDLFNTKFSPQAYIKKCQKIYQSVLICS